MHKVIASVAKGQSVDAAPLWLKAFRLFLCDFVDYFFPRHVHKQTSPRPTKTRGARLVVLMLTGHAAIRLL